LPLLTISLYAAYDSTNAGFGIGKLFADPNLLGKLAVNPRTAKHLADPSFRQKLEFIQTNPTLAESMLSGDPRLIDILGVLMGIDMQGFSRPEGSDDLPPGVVPGTIPDPPSPRPQKSPTPQASSSKSPPPPPEPAKVEEDVEMQEDEDDEDAKAKKEAEAEKKLGAEAYKKRDLETAAVHFSKAWDAWPKDITFLTNLGGRRIPFLTFNAFF
jgi:stress-induced-phosphoprotein 1